MKNNYFFVKIFLPLSISDTPFCYNAEKENAYEKNCFAPDDIR